MKALVIGGTGPTGPYVVKGLLRRGYQVAVLHRGVHEVEFPSEVQHIHADPHFAETLAGALDNRVFDLIVALYGRLRHIADVAKGRTERLITVGGASFREGAPRPIPESAPLITDPTRKFHYLRWLAQQAVLEAHQQGIYCATIFRYPILYGPRQLAPWEWSVVRRLLDGRRWLLIPDGGLALECLAYVENAAHAVLLAVDQPEPSAGQVYNVADERALTLRERIEIIAQELGRPCELVSIPSEVAVARLPYWGAISADGRVAHNQRDIAKIERELGYRDVVPPEEAVRRTARWLVENAPEPGGELEQQLGDPFDYATEDRIVEEMKQLTARLSSIPVTPWQYRHPYPHPRQPMPPVTG